MHKDVLRTEVFGSAEEKLPHFQRNDDKPPGHSRMGANTSAPKKMLCEHVKLEQAIRVSRSTAQPHV